MLATNHIINEGKALWEEPAIGSYADGELDRKQCYMHTRESILENEYNEIHWKVEIKSYNVIEFRKVELVIGNKE